jgi:succinate dehydrogenase/fumarate reductase-like Fe-S protein
MSDLNRFQIELNGEKLNAYKGQTIAEALVANRELMFRKTQKNIFRGPFCGMGVCYECQMRVNGELNVRTCITEATPGIRVETQIDGQIDDQKARQ